MWRSTVLLFLIFLLSISFLNAQKHLARITLNDSTVLDGYASFIDEGKSVVFKKNKKGSIQEYSFSQIQKVEILKSGKRKTYTYIKVINQGTVKLAEILISGRLSLFQFSYEAEGWVAPAVNLPGANVNVNSPNGPVAISIAAAPTFYAAYGKKTFKDYAVKRDGEEKARFFKDSAAGASFKQIGAYYFQNCPALVARIESGTFNLRKLPEIVTFYNANCE